MWRLTQDDTQQDYPLTLKTEPLYFFAALLLQHNLPPNQLKISAFTTFAYIYCSHSYDRFNTRTASVLVPPTGAATVSQMVRYNFIVWVQEPVLCLNTSYVDHTVESYGERAKFNIHEGNFRCYIC